jgi:hypothetical protein
VWGITLLLALAGGPDPSAVARWEARLGDDDLRTRGRAQADLVAFGQAARPVVRCLQKSRDPEVRRRAKEVHAALRRQALRSLWPFPCLDAAWYDTNRRLYRESGFVYEKLSPYLRRMDMKMYLGWDGYREATRIWVGDLYDAGVPLWAIKMCLAEMRRRDAVWIKTRGLPYKPVAR